MRRHTDKDQGADQGAEAEVDSGWLDGSGRLTNPGTTPVVYTNDGRILAGGERVWVPALDETGKAAVTRGLLRWKPDATTTATTATQADTSPSAEDVPPEQDEPIAEENGEVEEH